MIDQKAPEALPRVVAPAAGIGKGTLIAAILGTVFVSAIVFTALGAVGYHLLVVKPVQEIVNDLPEITATPYEESNGTEIEVGAKQYKNAAENYMLEYPADWAVTEDKPNNKVRISKANYTLVIEVPEAWGPEPCIYDDTPQSVIDDIPGYIPRNPKTDYSEYRSSTHWFRRDTEFIEKMQFVCSSIIEDAEPSGVYGEAFDMDLTDDRAARIYVVSTDGIKDMELEREVDSIIVSLINIR